MPLFCLHVLINMTNWIKEPDDQNDSFKYGFATIYFLALRLVVYFIHKLCNIIAFDNYQNY